ncbi:MAG TPA: hypothetical protein VF969_04775, partial [Burkholderiales bacterium]
MRAASVTNVPTGSGVRRQVRPATVDVKRATTSEGAAAAAELNSVLSDDIDDRMLLSQQVSVDAICAGSHGRLRDRAERPKRNPPQRTSNVECEETTAPYSAAAARSR